jgi:hypothetical protein
MFEDDRQPLVGQQVLLQGPLLDRGGRLPERYVVTELRGLIAVLSPAEGESSPVFRPGVPVVVTFGYPEFPRLLEGVTVESAWDPGMLCVRLPKLPEQRAHARYHESLGVEVQMIGDGAATSDPFPADALDISAGGIRLRAAVTMDNKQRCFITMGLPEGQPVIAIGELVADSIRSEDNRFESRFRFTTVSEDDRGRLVAYLTKGTTGQPRIPLPEAIVSKTVEDATEHTPAV